MLLWFSIVTSERSIQTTYCLTESVPFICREKFPDLFAFQGGPNDRSDPNSYLYWVVCISGVVLLPLALIHAALRLPYAAYIGTIVS